MKTMYWKTQVWKSEKKSWAEVQEFENGAVYKIICNVYPTTRCDEPSGSEIFWEVNREKAIETAVDFVRKEI